MSVRNVILGLLTLGPAYGHQLLFEIHGRLPHRATVNPGQVYATLTRLATSGLIEDAGISTDQLPLYRLSSEGKAKAAAWLDAESEVDVSDWSEVLDVVLLSLTLPGGRIEHTSDGVRRQLAEWAVTAPEHTIEVDALRYLVQEGRIAHSTAVRKWLEHVVSTSARNVDVTRGFTPNRPRRGRRPKLVK